MKDKVWQIMIALLLVLQGVTFFKLQDLQRMIQQQAQDKYVIQNQLSSQVSQLEQNIKDLLTKQESIVEHTEVMYGAFDSANLMIPITYLVTPKEVTSNTNVILEVDGVMQSMKRSGTSFSYTKEQALFEQVATPVIQITEGTVSRSEHHDGLQVDQLANAFFPNLFIEPIYQGTGDKAGYGFSGTIYLHSKPSMLFPDAVRFVSASLVIKKNQTIVKQYPLNLSGSETRFQETVLLEQGETVTWTVVAKDSLNMEHHFLLSGYTQGTGTLEPENDKIQIYDATGKLLGVIDRYW